ncbi:MAG: dCMP deaminase family protein [Proteobacteria bacterium]|nr:dCMP deaminase family protein [Pseudomonadota bacterium]
MTASSDSKWDRRFMELATFIAGWSKDPSTKVGAVVVQPRNRRIVATGYNGFPAGVEDSEDRLGDRSIKYEMVVHAEQNALMFAGNQAEGCTLYVTPLPPCARCAVLIIQSGVRRVVSPTPDKSKEPWATQSKIAEQMFKESKVEFLYLDL